MWTSCASLAKHLLARGTCVQPTSRGRIHDTPYSAGIASFAVAVVTFAPVTANRMSEKAASAMATPAQAPFTAQIRGKRSPSCQTRSSSNSGRTP